MQRVYNDLLVDTASPARVTFSTPTPIIQISDEEKIRALARQLLDWVSKRAMRPPED